MKLPSCYLFYNGDVFDLFLLFMSVEEMEIMFVERRKAAVQRSALTSRPSASQTRFSLGSEASVRAEGRRSPTVEENRTPSLFSCSPSLRVRKGRWFHLRKFVSPLLWKRRSEMSGRSQKPLLFIIGWCRTWREIKILFFLWLNIFGFGYYIITSVKKNKTQCYL